MRAAQLHINTANRTVYNGGETVSYYAALEYLTPCERLLFEAYLKPGMSVLDLGVGGGRTTPYLAGLASRYVGVDYAEEMVRACRNKFPGLEFVQADAADLSVFDDYSFDVVVMAFNALDYVVPDSNRLRCLAEVRRVLRRDGVFLFSSHNPLAILTRPAWDRDRLAAFARGLGNPDRRLFQITMPSLAALKTVHAFLRAVSTSFTRVIRRMPTAAFWRGEGYLLDPAHGGLVTHVWVPKCAITELGRFGFRVVRVMPHDYPQAASRFLTDWYYYVFHAER